jgi:hypothetical protein
MKICAFTGLCYCPAGGVCEPVDKTSGFLRAESVMVVEKISFKITSHQLVKFVIWHALS